jgi:glucose-1-phosphatase
MFMLGCGLSATGVCMITDVIFDLGNVLVPFDREIAYGRLRPHLSADKALMLERDRKRFEALLRTPAIDLETGKTDFDDFRRSVQEILDTDIEEDEFLSIWCDMFRMNEDTVALGEFLSSRYRTWLASNTSKAHYDWILDRFPRVAFYRGAALSYELGLVKPSKEYFRKTVDLFGIAGESAVFIDDLEENVASAVATGMKGIVFRDYQQLLGDLRMLGIRVPEERGTGK